MNPESRIAPRLRQLGKAYYIAKSAVIEEGFAWEVDWQYSVSLETIDEQTFLCEAAWVILNSGMRESVIRKKFAGVSQAFHDWQSAQLIVKEAEACRVSALRHFGHAGKIGAILSVAEHLNTTGINAVIEQISKYGASYLQRFPFIGPTTSLHLAKNLGLPVAKPDRHLRRIASSFGYKRVQELCEEIALLTDEPIPVIDIVLWRYATRHKREIIRFSKLLNRNRVSTSK